MEYPWERLQAQLQSELNTCTWEHRPYLKMLECCFHIAERTWLDCQRLVDGFESTGDEIKFFKNVKPNFTSEIEYYHFVYQAELFAPAEDPRKLEAYWTREQGKPDLFREKQGCFLAYIDSGNTGKDEYWFTRATLDTEVMGPRIYDGDSYLLTNGDPLLATWYALTRYQQYCTTQLQRLTLQINQQPPDGKV